MSDAVTTTPEDDRLIRETGIDARIAAIVLPAARAAGFRLVRVRLSAQNGLTLQIMAERPDGTMTVRDCEDLSRVVSPALDVEDPIEKAYHLEVSSPGIDRPLVRRSDFEVAKGHIAKIETAILIGDRKRFRGRIADVTETSVMIERDQASYGDEPTVEIPLDALSDARLVLTDELIRESLARDKQARRMAERDDDDAPEAGTEDDN